MAQAAAYRFDGVAGGDALGSAMLRRPTSVIASDSEAIQTAAHEAAGGLHRSQPPQLHGEMLPAIAREKQIKAGSRKKKLALIEALNPAWNDLYESILW